MRATSHRSSAVRQRSALIPLLRGSVPLHRQLSYLLRSAILAGEWPVGNTLPAERELALSHGVSRITVRHALAALESEGLIRRSRPKGNVVARSRPRRDSVWTFESLQDVVAFGERTRVQIVSFAKQRPPEEVARIFGFASGVSLPCVHGVRSLDATPLSEFHFWIAPSVAAQLTPEDLRQPTLFSAIESRTGIRLVEARQTVWCEPAALGVARNLRMRPGAPVLGIRRVYLAERGVPVEIAISRFHGARYQLNHVLTRLSRSPADSP
ncbi:MAG TPA: GntR family transcriptional regulator [Casimicrobiaceae bacterium]|nr:GntR family transcriptional regulator [Casimicrobiaceae bacterium]